MTSAITDDEAAITLATQLAAAVRDFRDGAEAYRLAAMGPPTQQAEQKQTFTIQSSAQSWLCVVAVVAALVWGLGKDGDKAEALVSMQAQISRQQVSIDRMQDYLNAIYMQAPHLKPPEDQERKKSP